ncbi:DUF3099 domain-containing protein [Nocardioides mangrovicus]|uniref:DUF3099 domain-containing protein n=1 Tax=Nocardioides mangrovicus TaxID=2478913 RepID=A0A3L8P160_9ACTN|nr:DUF3099 domain-containing protein [Nocardioides mangrovicus]RLV48761.1 DUF3099 domain-containing protein [Nocardioides mangrovicus]
MAKGARRDEGVVEITSAAPSRDVDIRIRQRRYLFSMALRTMCFVGAIVTQGWVRWTLVAGAIVLPYVAVVMANAASPQLPGAGPESPGPGRDQYPQLPPGAQRHT